MPGLYIHIPFCAHKCTYCDFVSFVCDERVQKSYVDCLLTESRLAAEKYADRCIETVFVGGGTPSILKCGEVKRIMDCVFSEFKVLSNAEITIECNPGTLDQKKLEEYRKSGINRLSMGLQSANDSVLRRISRIHTLKDFMLSLKYARLIGFENINADIMYGLPSQSLDDVKETLACVCDLKIPHISAYSLIVEENTPLYDSLAKGELCLPDEDLAYDMHRLVIDTLKSAGYNRYEISNYSKPGMECKHNLCYWDAGEYIGLGINAHSAMYIDGVFTRYNNTCDLSEYEKSVLSGKLPSENEEQITGYEAMAEYVMLGLRKTSGFLLSDFRKRFSKDFTDVFGDRLAHINPEFYTLNSSLSLTDKGLDLQNIILCELI